VLEWAGLPLRFPGKQEQQAAAVQIMAFTDELFESAKPIWEAQIGHPFVQGIARGDLPEGVFERWVLQDYRFLIEFSRVLGWAAAKADRLESMSWYATVLNLTLNSEMALHRVYASRFGLTTTELEAEPMWPTTRAYTDFLVRVAADGDLADLVAALLPCPWGYVYIGQKLAVAGLPDDQRFADWIRQYSAPEFEEAARWLQGEMNRLASDASKEKRRRLTELFLISSRYEWLFWEMCWRGEEWPFQEEG
jgi:thiaminase/transcriptional activator TenA